MVWASIYMPLLTERVAKEARAINMLLLRSKNLAPINSRRIVLLPSTNPCTNIHDLRATRIGLFAGLHVFLEKFDDVFGVGAGEEDFGDA